MSTGCIVVSSIANIDWKFNVIWSIFWNFDLQFSDYISIGKFLLPFKKKKNYYYKIFKYITYENLRNYLFQKSWYTHRRLIK